MKYSRIIAIDPDLHKCGYAMLENGEFKQISSLPLWSIFNLLLGNTKKELYLIPTELLNDAFTLNEFIQEWHNTVGKLMIKREPIQKDVPQAQVQSILPSTIILIEDPRLVNHHVATWHKGGVGAARNVGKCEAIAILLDEFCKDHKLNYRMIAPAGYSAFFNNEKVFQNTTGWAGKTNKDARAAGAMAWSFKDTNL